MMNTHKISKLSDELCDLPIKQLKKLYIECDDEFKKAIYKRMLLLKYTIKKRKKIIEEKKYEFTINDIEIDIESFGVDDVEQEPKQKKDPSPDTLLFDRMMSEADTIVHRSDSKKEFIPPYDEQNQ